MAKLPRYAAAHLALAVLLWLAAPAAAQEALDLEGTWYLLVHYTDDHSARPEALRWDDRIWVFEKVGSRLRWTEFPIVVFRDRSGRFEGAHQSRRQVHAWEPNQNQLEQIESGLEINQRGSRSKTLRGSASQGWRSQSRAAPESASVVTYTEHWSITGPPGQPVFERLDMLGSAESEGMDGRTRFTTTEAEPGLLRGLFERDGTRHGSFRLMRAGPAEWVKGSGKTQGERAMQGWIGDWASSVRSGEEVIPEPIRRRMIEDQALPEELRQEIRTEIRHSIERSMRRRGFDPRRYQDHIDALVDEIEPRVVEEGRSLEDVVRMLEEGEIAP